VTDSPNPYQTPRADSGRTGRVPFLLAAVVAGAGNLAAIACVLPLLSLREGQVVRPFATEGGMVCSAMLTAIIGLPLWWVGSRREGAQGWRKWFIAALCVSPLPLSICLAEIILWMVGAQLGD
jgi:hypothetical protein